MMDLMRNTGTMIKCIAIDDEPLALSVIEQFCGRIGHMELRTFSDPGQGIEAILSTKPDLVFLDIEMSEISGLKIARKLPPGTCFIFTTAHINYALDGFDLDAVDFLHKPFSFERFEKSVKKALRRMGHDDSPDHIIVRQEYTNTPVRISEIQYIEAMENYVKIFREGNDPVVAHTSLKNIQGMLPQERFVRIHRSYVVSLAHITGFTNGQVRLGEKICLPVGRQYSGWQEVYRRFYAR